MAPLSSLPLLYTAAECRELDRLAIEEARIAGFELMQRAGRAAFRELIGRWPEAARIAVCCGRGNNAGDGYIVAGLAREAGLEVVVHQLGDPAGLSGDAGRARDWARDRGVAVATGSLEEISADVVVDALLGTGIKGELKEAFARATETINACGRPVLAIDIPTGVNADTGAASAHAVRAALTVTFIGRKLGLYTGPGVSLAGTVIFDDLGVPKSIYRRLGGCPWLHYPNLPTRYRLPPRDANAHKHGLGHVVVVGGDHDMGGATAMAGEAALRTGAGMVSIVTRALHRSAILARRPEIMVVDADDQAARKGVLARADILVVGPGLGRREWGRGLFLEALELKRPTVLDADGLNQLAALDLRPQVPVVVTPHAGEAARLLGSSSAEVQSDRPRAALALARRVGGAAVLKGAGSVIAEHRDGDAEGALLGICAHGNPGMASAGMGDVLSGVVGGLLAQGASTAAAAVAATCLHSLAGDRAADRLGQRSVVATDLLEPLTAILREEERGWR